MIKPISLYRVNITLSNNLINKGVIKASIKLPTIIRSNMHNAMSVKTTICLVAPSLRPVVRLLINAIENDIPATDDKINAGMANKF